MANKLWKKFMVPTVIMLAALVVGMITEKSEDVKIDILEKANLEIKHNIDHINSTLTNTNDLVIQQVEIGMKTLMDEAKVYGNPSIQGNVEFLGSTIPNLVIGRQQIAQDYTIVDKVKSIAGGTATIFLKNGSEYLRVSTNVKKADGERAIGTILAPNGRAIKKINNKEAYYGLVNILGNPYLTGYEPIFDTNNNILGIWYTGYKLESLKKLGETISEASILEKGFVALINESGEPIFNSAKYSKEQIKELLNEQKDDWVVSEQNYDAWNYKVVAAANHAEIDELVEASVKKEILIIIGFSVLVLISVFVLVYFLLLRPIKFMEDAANKFINGKNDARINYKSKDELGRLSSVLNNLMQKTVENIDTLKQKELDAIEVAASAEESRNEAQNQKEYFARKTNEMLIEMEKLTNGDLSVNLNVEKNDEVGKLFKGFNNVVQKISNLMNELKQIVEVTVGASNKIKSGSDHVALNASEQSIQVTDIASAIEQMTSTIFETTRNTTNASEAAKSAGDLAQQGGQVVNQTVDGMNQIAEVVDSAANTINELGKSSEKIDEIIQVINDIADQTNLLALNAAIEAARAGEQGRGFAVVADEVRKLAERTTSATKEIAEMIGVIHQNTTGAVLSIKNGSEKVNSGKSLASEAGKSLEEIINSSNKVVDVIVQVAAASEEQSSTAQQISKSIEAINHFSQDTANGIKEIASSAEELYNLTDNIQRLIDQFKIQENSYSYSSNNINSKNKEFA